MLLRTEQIHNTAPIIQPVSAARNARECLLRWAAAVPAQERCCVANALRACRLPGCVPGCSFLAANHVGVSSAPLRLHLRLLAAPQLLELPVDITCGGR